MAENQSKQNDSPVNDNQSKSTLKDIITSEKLVIPEGENPLWYVSREDMGLSPVPPENNEEKTPDWKITKEDMGLIDMNDKALSISGPAYASNDLSKTVEIMHQHYAGIPKNDIFGEGGTDFSQVLHQAFEDMQKANPDMPRHALILTDGEPMQTTDSELKEPGEEVKPEEQKIEWKEALKKYLQDNPTTFVNIDQSLNEGFVFRDVFGGIPKSDSESENLPFVKYKRTDSNSLNDSTDEKQTVDNNKQSRITLDLPPQTTSKLENGLKFDYENKKLIPVSAEEFKNIVEKDLSQTSLTSSQEGRNFIEAVNAGQPIFLVDETLPSISKTKEELSQRIKNVNANLNANNDSDNKNKPK